MSLLASCTTNRYSNRMKRNRFHCHRSKSSEVMCALLNSQCMGYIFEVVRNVNPCLVVVEIRKQSKHNSITYGNIDTGKWKWKWKVHFCWSYVWKTVHGKNVTCENVRDKIVIIEFIEMCAITKKVNFEGRCLHLVILRWVIVNTCWCWLSRSLGVSMHLYWNP